VAGKGLKWVLKLLSQGNRNKLGKKGQDRGLVPWGKEKASNGKAPSWWEGKTGPKKYVPKKPTRRVQLKANPKKITFVGCETTKQAGWVAFGVWREIERGKGKHRRLEDNKHGEDIKKIRTTKPKLNVNHKAKVWGKDEKEFSLGERMYWSGA